MKRTIHDNTGERFLKEVAQTKRSNRGKVVPRGFQYSVSANGTLMIKNLKTGAETPLA